MNREVKRKKANIGNVEEMVSGYLGTYHASMVQPDLKETRDKSLKIALIAGAVSGAVFSVFAVCMAIILL